MPTPVHPPGGTSAGPGPSGGPGPVAVTPPGGASRRRKKGNGHHGVLGLAQNISGDVYSTIAGIGPGAVALGEATAHDVTKFAKHPIRYNPQRDSELRKKIVAPVVKSYKQTYGPLAHGDVNTFLHNLYDHPLGPVMDLATIATLGAGGAAKAGKILADAGAISKESRLANLSRVEQEVLRPPKGLSEPKLGKVYNRNPLIRARQKALKKVLDALPDHVPHLDATSRYAREGERLPRKDFLRHARQSEAYNKAFSKLNLEEQAALHLIGRRMHPTDYLNYLRKQDGRVEPEMLKALQNPKVIQLYEHPTDVMRKAHVEATKLTALDAELKGIAPVSAKEKIDRAAHAVYGDNIPEHPAGLGGFYVPDRVAHERLSNASGENLGGGLGNPQLTSGMRHNTMTLFRTGQIALHGNLIGREYLSTLKYGLHDDLHDVLMGAARKTSQQEIRDYGLPKGWTFVPKRVRTKTGSFTSQKIHPVFRKTGEGKAQLHELVPKPDELPELFTQDPAQAQMLHGDYLIVPKRLAREVSGEFRRSSAAVRILIEKPTSFWRSVILGYRVGFLANNEIGNNLMLAAKLGGINFAKAYLHTIKDSKLVRRMIGQAPNDWRGELMDEFFPEQRQTFGATQKSGYFRDRLEKHPKTKRVASAVEHGIVPLTQDLAETQLRKVALETVLRGTPEVKKLFRAMPRQTRSWKVATENALRENPVLEREISQKINDALGDYTSLSPFERSALRNVAPFYAWYKVIFTVTGKLAVDNPLRANILAKVGVVGNDVNQDRLGALPDFMQHVIPFGKTKNGKHTVLSSQGLNPYYTVNQVGPGLTGLIGGKVSDIGKSYAQIGPNPIVLALAQSIAGKDLFTGRAFNKTDHPLAARAPGLGPQVGAQLIESLPPFGLARSAQGHGRTSKSYGRETFLRALLGQSGLPLKPLDVNLAHQYANRP